MQTQETMIAQTKKWILDVVIGANFCPFAAKEFKANRIHYAFAPEGNMKAAMLAFIGACEHLDDHPEIETSFLIFPFNFDVFADYLGLVSKAENALFKNSYEGVFQLASFHPLYCFAGSNLDDAANYTNRSIYPMLHLLRESSIELALEKYTDPEGIPERNINFAQTKGLAYMKLLREQCF